LIFRETPCREPTVVSVSNGRLGIGINIDISLAIRRIRGFSLAIR